ncbi:MAG: Ldh family oxidoreductase [Tepidisphaeraceae bacterium]|jgi:3-dehydro-L-gulonate 2-dehydrogenase
MPRIPEDRLVSHLTELLAREGVSPPRAHRLAELYTQASADGVYSHGVHFVPGLLRSLRAGQIPDTQSDPRLIASFGALQRYDGNAGLGALNAEFCIDRAMALAEAHGIGCVALRNTRHWGRPGNYGWRAAEKGYLAICWTNTPPNMPAWGGSADAVGNNPLVLTAPGESGEHLVLDMALSQFSFGRLKTHRAEHQPLPVVGGIDASGNPTTDAAAILDGGHPWPIGFWKGSGLAILLDAFAAILSDGLDSASLKPGPGDPGVSQVYLAFAPAHLHGRPAAQRTGEILRQLAISSPQSRYPGQAALAHRRRSQIEGVYVRDDIWQELS